jgi:hypothetical protein
LRFKSRTRSFLFSACSTHRRNLSLISDHVNGMYMYPRLVGWYGLFKWRCIAHLLLISHLCDASNDIVRWFSSVTCGNRKEECCHDRDKALWILVCITHGLSDIVIFKTTKHGRQSWAFMPITIHLRIIFESESLGGATEPRLIDDDDWFWSFRSDRPSFVRESTVRDLIFDASFDRHCVLIYTT